MDFRLSVREAVDALKEFGLLESVSKLPSRDRPTNIVIDTKMVRNGDIFICYKGTRFDTHSLLPQICHQGAGLAVIDDRSAIARCHIPYALVKNSRAAWSVLASKGYSFPQKKLRVIGITGTNGKTSTAWLAREILRVQGVPCLFLGTLGCYLGEKFFSTSHTTPDPSDLFSYFSKAVELGIEYVVMEVSSIAIDQRKLEPIKFAATAFTSFSRDHLDYHGSIDAYLETKVRFVRENLRCGLSLVHKSIATLENVGDLDGVTIYGDEYKVSFTTAGIQLKLADRHGELSLFGDYTADNFVAALKLVEGLTGEQCPPELWSKMQPVPGRLEPVEVGSRIIVDYAHTPDALEKTLILIKKRVAGRLWVLFGCGGDRDRGKRAEMGAVASKVADEIVITSDNPRTEDPEEIISHILEGIEKQECCHVIGDRRKAIAYAVPRLEKDDWLLIAGKGHEDYQIIGHEKIAFDDRKVALEILSERSGTSGV